ncbi:MAG: hypothetical protein ABJA66_18300 [Actinomycetota bacterium]
MPKETTIFIICLLALFADALFLWQTTSFRFGGNLLIDNFYGGAMIAVQIAVALALLWLSYNLLRKIIDRTLD